MLATAVASLHIVHIVRMAQSRTNTLPISPISKSRSQTRALRSFNYWIILFLLASSLENRTQARRLQLMIMVHTTHISQICWSACSPRHNSSGSWYRNPPAAREGPPDLLFTYAGEGKKPVFPPTRYTTHAHSGCENEKTRVRVSEGDRERERESINKRARHTHSRIRKHKHKADLWIFMLPNSRRTLFRFLSLFSVPTPVSLYSFIFYYRFLPPPLGKGKWMKTYLHKICVEIKETTALFHL